MGKTYKRGSSDKRFDDGSYGDYSPSEQEKKKRADAEKRKKAKEKKYIEDVEE